MIALNILNMFLTGCLAIVLVHMVKIHRLANWMNRKPFTCEVCMAGWLAVPFCWHDWYTPLYMAGSMVACYLIYQLMQRA